MPQMVVGPAAQIRHERRRQGEDITLAQVPLDQRLLRIRRRGGPDFHLAQFGMPAQLRHQRRKTGEDITLARAFDQRLLRLRNQGGEVTTL